MINYITLFTAFFIAGVAEYFSIVGLTAIFSGSFYPIIVMGVTMALGKIVTVSWLYRNWNTSPSVVKYYLITAVAILMLITSLGTFGYLSKAHLEQGVTTYDAVSKVEILDEKIKLSKDNIDANRKALKQLDEAVDQVMARSTSETGADKSVAIRRSQSKERTRLLQDIAAEQKVIAQLNEERAPIAIQARKVEAEVGPLKYVAELVYGNSDQSTVEITVRWVIFLIAIILDPLATAMLVAANHGIYGKYKPTSDTREMKMPKQVDWSWIKNINNLNFKRKADKIEVDPDSILKL